MSKNKKDPVVPVVVRELIEESETIQGWLEILPRHADEAYPEVFERVREDYDGRHGVVAEQLMEHRPDLLTSLEERQGTVKSLRAERDSNTADLQEVGLRRAVGEFSEEQWDSRRNTIEAALGEVDAILSVEEEAVAELTAVVDSVDSIVEVQNPPPISIVLETAVEREARAEAAAASAAAEKAVAQTRTWSEVVSRIPEEPVEVDEAVSDDELAFLESVSTEDFKRLDPINAAFLNGN